MSLYTSRRGVVFELEFMVPSIPLDADYWGYFWRATDPNKRARIFRVLIMRSLFAEEGGAREFAQCGDPAAEVYALLEAADSNGTPMTFPDLRRGWAVF